MAPPHVLALILAGGAGSRLELLTERRAKPAVPYGGSYRLIDIPLSNCRHSGIRDVWVVQQQHPASLADALANGRPWDLDRSTGGLLVLPPAMGSKREGWHHGTADALWKQAELIRELAPEVLLVLSADAVYRQDYAALVEEHCAAAAAVTMVTTQLPSGDASRYGVVVPGPDGAIQDYAYKPEQPASDIITTEAFAFDPERVLSELDAIAARVGGEGERIGDLGDELLGTLVAEGTAREHRHQGYWRDLGTVDAYWDSHQDLVRDEPHFRLDDPSWPILTAASRSPAARVRRGAVVKDSLLSGGAEVRGTVEDSVLSPAVIVEESAVVRRSVLLPGAVVRAGAVVEDAVLDSGVIVGRDCSVGESDGGVTLLGRRATLPPGTTVSAGGRYPEGDDD